MFWQAITDKKNLEKEMFLLVYISCPGGIHCEFSEYSSVVHWSGLPQPSLSLIPILHI
jgi:hypothetical protein